MADTPDSRPIFYYPARAGINKDHLTLFKACEKLFAKGLDFEVVLTGHKTQHFADTDPYDDDIAIETCRAFLQKNQTLFQDRVKPRGYCPRSDVEWAGFSIIDRTSPASCRAGTYPAPVTGGCSPSPAAIA